MGLCAECGTYLGFSPSAPPPICKLSVTQIIFKKRDREIYLCSSGVGGNFTPRRERLRNCLTRIILSLRFKNLTVEKSETIRNEVVGMQIYQNVKETFIHDLSLFVEKANNNSKRSAKRPNNIDSIENQIIIAHSN